MATGARFNPLNTRVVGANVVDALLARPAEPMGTLTTFIGAGIYAIYYTGGFVPYVVISSENQSSEFGRPIYIGKAVPSGTRAGGILADEYTGTALYRRLVQHAESVRATSNLDISDFFCRYLIVDDVWIPLAESFLITRFSPLWNLLITGFGNHNPGGGRHAGLRPRWDTLHPGRSWAIMCRERPETAEQIALEIEAHLRAGADLESLLGEPPMTENGSISAI